MALLCADNKLSTGRRLIEGSLAFLDIGVAQSAMLVGEVQQRLKELKAFEGEAVFIRKSGINKISDLAAQLIDLKNESYKNFVQQLQAEFDKRYEAKKPAPAAGLEAVRTVPGTRDVSPKNE